MLSQLLAVLHVAPFCGLCSRFGLHIWITTQLEDLANYVEYIQVSVL